MGNDIGRKKSGVWHVVSYLLLSWWFISGHEFYEDF